MVRKREKGHNNLIPLCPLIDFFEGITDGITEGRWIESWEYALNEKFSKLKNESMGHKNM